MTDRITSGAAVHALAVDLTHEPVAAPHNPSQGTTTAVHEIGTWQGFETGIWEMSDGVMYDTEATELFIVLSGSAKIEYLEPQLDPVTVTAGSVVALDEGMRTKWTVTDGPLRKIYITPED